MNSIVLKNIIYQYGLQLARYVLPLLTIPYLTRTFGADTYAVRAYTLALMTFVMVFLDFGLVLYGTKRISEALTDRRLTNIAVSEITYLRGLLAVGGAVSIIILGRSIELLDGYSTFLCFSYLATMFKALVPDFIFHAHQEMAIITNRFVATQTLGTCAIFIFVRSSADITLLGIIEMSAALMAFIWSWQNVYVRYKVRLCQIEIRGLLSTLTQGSIFFVSVVSTTFLSSFTALMLGSFSNNSIDIAIWSLAVTVIGAVTALYAPISNSIYPQVLATKNLALVGKFLRLGLPAVALVSFGVALGREPLIYLLGGAEFVSGSYIFLLVAPVLFLSYPVILLGFPTLGAVGQVKLLTLSSVAAAAFNVLVLVILVHTGAFSLATAALTRVASELLLLLLRLVFVRFTILRRPPMSS